MSDDVLIRSELADALIRGELATAEDERIRTCLLGSIGAMSEHEWEFFVEWFRLVFRTNEGCFVPNNGGAYDPFLACRRDTYGEVLRVLEKFRKIVVDAGAVGGVNVKKPLL